LRKGRLSISENLIHYFSSHERIKVGNLTIKAFPKFHDACDPHSFIIHDDEVCIGVFTDIGKACEQIIYHFKQCNAVFLEANYDSKMLAEGNYPYSLKRRISGGCGHLSNAEALELFCMHKPNKLTHLILSHLSKNNNSPELVQNIFMKHAGEIKVIVASRYKESEVYCIQYTSAVSQGKIYYNQHAVQLNMFN
jgi:phosphoribosyl 1,2-cyclic phosphodiesterase